MDRILEVLLKKNKNHSGTILEILVVFIISLFIVTLNLDINSVIKNIIIISLVLILFLIYLIPLIKERKIPKSKKRTDILVRIIAKDENDYNEIAKMFIDELILYTRNKTSDFNFLLIPYRATERSLKYTEDILFKKSKCKLLLDIKITSDSVNRNTNYAINFNFLFDKLEYNRKIKKRLKYEINSLIHRIYKYNYSKQNKSEAYNFFINQVYNISFYLHTKIFLYLNHNYNDTIRNGERLISSLNKDNNEKNLLDLTNQVCYNSCRKKIKELFNTGEPDYKQIQEILLKSNAFEQQQPSFYYRDLGICYFYNGRKISKIKELIRIYKESDDDNTNDEKWRYYDAIISAYEGESEQIILDKLLLAFNQKYNINELIDIIEKIPELETKNMLIFTLFILYFESKRIKNGKIYLEKYLSKTNTNSLEPKTLQKLSEKYDFGVTS